MTRARLLVLETGGTVGAVAVDAAVLGHRDAQTLAPLIKAQALGLGLQVRVETWTDGSGTRLPPCDSCEIGPSQWQMLAAYIASRRHEFEGFVILHGTDTLAYTAAALAFALPDLDKPVVLTGAMRPASEADTDAPANIRLALDTAASTAGSRVVVAFGGRVLDGVRVRKASVTAAAAFCGPQAVYKGSPHSSGARSAQNSWPAFDDRIAMFSLWPGADPETLHATVRGMSAHGVVLELFGAGTAFRARALAGCIADLRRQGVLCVGVSQCAQGGVDLGRYEAARLLRQAGLVSGGDMTREAACVKLMWVLAQPVLLAARAQLFETNVVGERTN